MFQLALPDREQARILDFPCSDPEMAALALRSESAARRRGASETAEKITPKPEMAPSGVPYGVATRRCSNLQHLVATRGRYQVRLDPAAPGGDPRKTFFIIIIIII